MASPPASAGRWHSGPRGSVYERNTHDHTHQLRRHPARRPGAARADLAGERRWRRPDHRGNPPGELGDVGPARHPRREAVMELPYDGDTNNPSQYCKHGTFIGSWWGPDYLCQACEDGEPAYEPTFDENATVTVAQMISEAAGLMLDGSEPEYLRALVELIVRCTPGLTHDDDVVIAGRISE